MTQIVNGWTRLEQTVALPDGVVAKAWRKGSLVALVSQEPHAHQLRWHLSISHPARYPHWDEIKDARYALLPLGLTFAQILPPPNEYTNIHRNCFHLWQIDDHEW